MVMKDYAILYNIHLLFVIAFLIIIGISSEFSNFHWYLKKNNTIITNINSNIETVIY